MQLWAESHENFVSSPLRQYSLNNCFVAAVRWLALATFVPIIGDRGACMDLWKMVVWSPRARVLETSGNYSRGTVTVVRSSRLLNDLQNCTDYTNDIGLDLRVNTGLASKSVFPDVTNRRPPFRCSQQITLVQGLHSRKENKFMSQSGIVRLQCQLETTAAMQSSIMGSVT